MRRFHFTIFALVLSIAQPLLAGTYYVGNCKVKSGYYTTISAAVAGVPSGSIVEVCGSPGTITYYYEQVIISKALTLEAVPNTGSVAISDYGVTLTTTTSIGGNTFAPQVLVTAGPVNLVNIGVAQQTLSPPPMEAGIFYASGSSGTVNGAEISGEENYTGIIAENGTGTTQSVTIENSYLVGQLSGISVDSSPSGLMATVKNNYISVTGGGIGLGSYNSAQGSMSGNFITFDASREGTGVYAEATQVSVSNNWIYNGSIGINSEASPGASVTSNHILNCITGIVISGNGASIKSNSIISTSGAIEFDCTTGNTVGANIINDTATGLDRVPSGFSGVNTFYNVDTRTTGCPSD